MADVDTVYFCYEANDECEECMLGKSAVTQDFASFHICFTSYIKKETPCAGFIRKLKHENQTLS